MAIMINKQLAPSNDARLLALAEAPADEYLQYLFKMHSLFIFVFMLIF